MTAPRFFAEDVSGDRVALTGDEARHAVTVLRIRPGEAVTISDGRGSVVEAVVEEAGSTLVSRVTGRATEPPPRPELVVFQALPKRGKLDLVVQKLTEIGAGEIRLFPAERSVTRWDRAKGRAQTARLAGIALQAAKQSRRSRLVEVAEPVSLTGLRLPEATVVLHEEATSRLLEALPADPPTALGLVVGPEGGLTPSEVATLRERGATPVSLGPLILRTETAALAAASIILARYGLLG